MEELIYKFRWQIAFFLTGLIFVASGIILYASNPFAQDSVEIIEKGSGIEQAQQSQIIVEVSGSVKNPGVYSFESSERIEDALNKAGGLSEDADNEWISKYLNRASPLKDGQKIYIPSSSEQSTDTSANNQGGYLGVSDDTSQTLGKTININTASQKELESLWGIGPVTAQNIIEQRPYSTVEELLTKKILKQNVYDKNKDLLSVY